MYPPLDAFIYLLYKQLDIRFFIFNNTNKHFSNACARIVILNNLIIGGSFMYHYKNDGCTIIILLLLFYLKFLTNICTILRMIIMIFKNGGDSI